MNGMAVKTHYSVLPLSLVFLYCIVDYVFSLIFLFRDVILTRGRFVFVFFRTSLDEGVVGKRGAACGNVTFGTAGRVLLAHSGVFLRCGGTWVTSWNCEPVYVCVLAKFVWQRSVCWLFSTLPPVMFTWSNKSHPVATFVCTPSRVSTSGQEFVSESLDRTSLVQCDNW